MKINSMKLKNYQEDIVIWAVRQVLRDERPDLLDEPIAINDIAAYVLNRLPARYIMSERGLTHFAAEQFEENDGNVAEMIKMMMLINRAMNLIQNRRQPYSVQKTDSAIVSEEQAMPLHNFPQVVGKVVDKEANVPVNNAWITLYINDAISEPAAPGWMNPCFTNPGNKGFFSFWPHAIRTDADKNKYAMKIIVEHPSYKPLTLEREIISSASYEMLETIDAKSILTLERIGLRRL